MAKFCDPKLWPLAEQLRELAQCGALDEILSEAGLRVVASPADLPPGWGILGVASPGRAAASPPANIQALPIAGMHAQNAYDSTGAGSRPGCAACAAMGKQIEELPDSEAANLPNIGTFDEDMFLKEEN